MSFIIFIFTISNNVFVVYAGDESDAMEHFGKNYEALNPMEKISVWIAYLCTAGGQVLNSDLIKAQDTMNEAVRYINGINYEKTLSEMTESELQTVLDNFIENLESKGCKCDSTGKVTMTDDFIKEFRSWFDDYIKENDKPMYYLVEMPCVGEKTLKASYCYSTAMYETIKYFVEQFGDCYVMKNSYLLYIIPLGSSTNYDYYTLYYGEYDIAKQFYVCDSVTEKIASSKYAKKEYYIIDFNTNKTSVTDLESDRISKVNTESNSVPRYTNMDYGYALDINGFSANGSNYTIDTFATIVTKEDKYIKVFTSLANYQDYKSGTYDQNVYYTTNYYKTTNIQQSPIGLDEMVKLYEAYDDLCQKIIQYVKDNETATNNMIVNKLDELINAVLSSSGSGGSTDININMSETNNILDKILQKINEIQKAVKEIANKEVIDLGEQSPVTEWITNITNIVVNPEANIDATIGDLSNSFEQPIGLLKTKFPFSIPWDIAFLLEFLADAPETPKFEIPMKFETLGIDEKLTIDFSHFESVSKVSRMLLTLLYMVALMNLTTKVFNIGGASND